MKKTLSALLVIVLSLVKANVIASMVDYNVNKATKETSDSIGDKNEGARKCGSKASPQ